MGQSINLSSSGTQCIGAYLAQPAGTPKGGLVVVQEIFGVNAHIRSVVDRFAEHGYTAIAPAIFDHVETDVELDYDHAGIDKGRALVAEVGVDLALTDIASAAEAISSAGRIGCVGYCWGGTMAYLAAARLGLPSVCYYGARAVAYLDEKPRAPVMFHFGERDHSIPPEVVEKHRIAMPDMPLFTYPAEHGFNCDLRSDYDAPSAALAFERTLQFFDAHLSHPMDQSP